MSAENGVTQDRCLIDNVALDREIGEFLEVSAVGQGFVLRRSLLSTYVFIYGAGNSSAAT